jgi:multisubunit Na+/H+ antiporter MnhF subunit
MDATAAAPDYRESIRATAALALWTLAWLATLAVARFGPDLLWGGQATWSWIAVVVNLIVGAGVIVAYTRYLSRADELDRKIMLDALAVTLGVAWVTGFAYVVAHAAGLVTIDIAVLLAAPGVVFVLAVVAGKIRYR